MKDIPLQGTKVCRTCGEEKHVLAFASDPSTKDHLQGECRDCVGERNKRRRSLKKGVKPIMQPATLGQYPDGGTFSYGNINKRHRHRYRLVPVTDLPNPTAGD